MKDDLSSSKKELKYNDLAHEKVRHIQLFAWHKKLKPIKISTARNWSAKELTAKYFSDLKQLHLLHWQTTWSINNVHKGKSSPLQDTDLNYWIEAIFHSKNVTDSNRESDLDTTHKTDKTSSSPVP